ncbi:Uncharacterised protein [Neisseria flavescens]|nr:hypothetical protein [Neisseria flavescens]SPY04097.1 Uncharacterised protein [Neisseria meningitidis]SPY11979.1 Uncharacterised protein [Neisseria meningitidis]STZ62664.1 Uncharacterised protein [Neisseria flavescens]
MSRQHPNIAVKRSPKNTWIIVEHVDTFYDKKHWSINGHFKRKAKTIAEYKTFEEAAEKAEYIRTNRSKGN